MGALEQRRQQHATLGSSLVRNPHCSPISIPNKGFIALLTRRNSGYYGAGPKFILRSARAASAESHRLYRSTPAQEEIQGLMEQAFAVGHKFILRLYNQPPPVYEYPKGARWAGP